ncbi:MAG: Ferredoxin--NADP reductase [Chlamydiae bacterium]|nr:Ferredoxin--NADP reductase [Chlamydiota bacterium]
MYRTEVPVEMNNFSLIILGGGAAGIFAAIAAKESSPNSTVAVLDKSAHLLAKVRISGGGRCNVTHACFDPKSLIQNYPRGSKELLGPFYRFQPQDTIDWFEKHGVQLKAEPDGRVFPVSDSSQTIIDCLLDHARTNEVEILLKQHVEAIEKTSSGFQLHLKDGHSLSCQKLLIATGSAKAGYLWAEKLGHTIQPPVPSLFTFNIPHFTLSHLSGIAIDPVEIALRNTSLSQKGSLLITHFGFSGPAALKLSAWGARQLHDSTYQAELDINWLPNDSEESIFNTLREAKKRTPQKTVGATRLFSLSKKLWQTLAEEMDDQKWIALPDKRLRQLAQKLVRDSYKTGGKSTHKEEFVTCGGIDLKEVDFKTMESKICPGLYFAGEILDIDGVTGGFNFQNAWTTGFLAGSSAQRENP